MTETKLEEYKGYQIVLKGDGVFEAWPITVEGTRKYTTYSDVTAKAETLAGLKEKINKLSKQKFGQEVYVANRHRNNEVLYVPGKITSMQETQRYDGAARHKYRVTYKEHPGSTNWEDLDLEELIKPTPENDAKIAKYHETQAQRNRLDKELEAIEKSFDTYTEEELTG